MRLYRSPSDYRHHLEALFSEYVRSAAVSNMTAEDLSDAGKYRIKAGLESSAYGQVMGGHLLDWALGEVAVSILAAPPGKAENQKEADTQLLGFVSQQIAQLVHAETVRFANSSLEAEIKELNETITLGKLLDRAVSLLVAKRRISPASAEEILLRASEEHGKPLIEMAQQVVLDLGNSALSSRRGRPRVNGAAA